MKRVGLILVLAVVYGVTAELDHKLLQTFDSIMQNGTVSESCQEALQIYKENLQNRTLWALQMFDATSKIPVGLLSLNLGELGQFDECLSIQSEDGFIQPKYCLGKMPLTVLSGALNNREALLYKRSQHLRHASRSLINLESSHEDTQEATQVGFQWAICLPSRCSDEDVEAIFEIILQNKPASCQTKEDLNPPLTAGAIAAIVMLSIFAFLLVASTALDLYYRYINKEPHHIVLIAFSMYSNGQKLFRISHNSNELTCLNGIRFLSMMWVIVGHVFSTPSSLMPLVNYKDVTTWADSLRSMTLVSGTLSVDSFFFLSGVLVVYSYMKAKHNGVRFNIFQFYIHRYLRLTPALAAGILVTGHLMKYLGSGPLWPSITTSLEHPCQKYWWSTLLYIQNYVNLNEMCVPQSWYLSPDMQLYIIAPLFLYPLWKYPKIGVGLTVTCILAFIAVPFTVAYINEFPALLTNFYLQAKVNDYMRVYYIKTHTRAAPWFIGLFIGYLLAKIKFRGGHRHLTVNKVLIILGWKICIACTFTCIYGGHSTLRGEEYDKWGNSLYIALVRPAWSICLSWVIFACVSGYGGPINWLLSLPIYQVLNRFTYSMYLIHLQFIYVYGFRSKTGLYFDEFNLAYSFWGTTMFTFFLSIPWVLAFESPIVILEKLIFGGSKRKNKLDENGNKNALPA